MKKCDSCGTPLREGVAFCPSCGSPVNGTVRGDNDYAIEVPLITLAPQQNTFSKQRVIRYIKMIIGMVLVVALALGGAVAAVWFSTSAKRTSNFAEVDNTKYKQCLALVDDVRNDNFNDYVSDIINMDGDAADYNFLEEYEALFKKIIPNEGSSETEIMFRNCCYMVSYTEFVAKKNEMFAQKPLIGRLFVEKADKYRNHANTLYAMLCEADTDSELQEIIDYCADNDIIYLK